MAGLLLATLMALVVSGWQPYDRATWLLEVAPVLIALPILIATSQLSADHHCVLVDFRACPGADSGWCLHLCARAGRRLVQQAFELSRNPYDKLGHFMQGFVPALIAREILIRGDYARGRRMITFICVCIALAISAAYELLEWWAALALGQGADQFLGRKVTRGIRSPICLRRPWRSVCFVRTVGGTRSATCVKPITAGDSSACRIVRGACVIGHSADCEFSITIALSQS